MPEKDQIRLKLKEFIDEEDKRDLYNECFDAIKFMLDHGIKMEDAVYTIKNVVRAVRNNYGD